MTKQPTIAGVILTLNEQQDLGRALSSLQWCNELVVLDSGSTDATQTVALAHGAKFYLHIQDPPFLISDQRNWALKNCDITSDWVLFLDADEEVNFQLQHRIVSEISKSSPFNSYVLTPRYWFLGKWLKRTQGFPNWHPRLLKRSCVSFEGGVWESFTSTALTSKIDIPYEHYAFSKGLDDWVKRHLRYAHFDAIQIDQFHQTCRHSSQRKRRLRILDAYLWKLKPLTRFIYKYLIQMGWTEGWQSLLYCSLISFYDLLVVVSLIQIRRRRLGKPL